MDIYDCSKEEQQAFIDHVEDMKRQDREYRYEQARSADMQAFITLVAFLVGLPACVYFFGFMPTALGIIILLLLALVGLTSGM